MTTLLCRCTVPHYWDATTTCAGRATTVDEVRTASLARLEAILTDPGMIDDDQHGKVLDESVETFSVERPDVELMVAFLRVLVHGMTPTEAIADLATAPRQEGPEPTVREVKAAQRMVPVSEVVGIFAAENGDPWFTLDEFIAGRGGRPPTSPGPGDLGRMSAHAMEARAEDHPVDCPWCAQARAATPDRDADPAVDELPADTPDHIRQAFAERDIGAVLNSFAAAWSMCPDCRTAKRFCAQHATEGPSA